MTMAGERGYAMAALLVGLSVMGIMLSVAMPVWRTAAQREREAELIFRGEQYAHAIELYSRRTGGYPPSLDVLEKGRFIRRLYKDPVAGGADFQPVFVGQIVGGQPVAPRQPGGRGPGGIPAPTGGSASPAQGARAGQPVGQPLGQPLGQTGGRGTVGGGPIIGVVSTSTSESIALYNGRGHYNEWAFVATALSQQAGSPTSATAPTPGVGGQRGGAPGPQRGDPFGTPRGGRPFGTPGMPTPRGGSAPQPR